MKIINLLISCVMLAFSANIWAANNLQIDNQQLITSFKNNSLAIKQSRQTPMSNKNHKIIDRKQKGLGLGFEGPPPKPKQ